MTELPDAAEEKDEEDKLPGQRHSERTCALDCYCEHEHSVH